MTKHILPRFGLSEKDVQLAQVPVPEVAAALVTGDIAAAFPFEPYGTNAVDKGAKLLLAPNDLIDKSKLNSDMLRNGMVMTRKFMKEHPELAKRLVWAHLDAVHLMKTDKKVGLEVLKHYTPNIDTSLLDKSYDNCGWQYDKPPRSWIEALMGWMKEDGLLQKPVTYEDVVDTSPGGQLSRLSRLRKAEVSGLPMLTVENLQQDVRFARLGDVRRSSTSICGSRRASSSACSVRRAAESRRCSRSSPA